MNGKLLFRSLSYFRECEDAARGDQFEGTSKFRPSGGLLGTNHTQRKRFTLADHSLESSVNAGEIFVFCTSRTFDACLWREFNAVTCVEITRIAALCSRIQAALPHDAVFTAKRVQYYPETEAGSTRWALPDVIATSKLERWEKQDEYRFMFSLTDALSFEKVQVRLVHDSYKRTPNRQKHEAYLLDVGSLHDICRFRELSFNDMLKMEPTK